MRHAPRFRRSPRHRRDHPIGHLGMDASVALSGLLLLSVLSLGGIEVADRKPWSKVPPHPTARVTTSPWTVDGMRQRRQPVWHTTKVKPRIRPGNPVLSPLPRFSCLVRDPPTARSCRKLALKKTRMLCLKNARQAKSSKRRARRRPCLWHRKNVWKRLRPWAKGNWTKRRRRWRVRRRSRGYAPGVAAARPGGRILLQGVGRRARILDRRGKTVASVQSAGPKAAIGSHQPIPRPIETAFMPPLIQFVNRHTKERLPIFGYHLPPRRILDDFLRCRYTGRTTHMDRMVVRAVLAAAASFRVGRVLIVSGYRDPKFNDRLRKKGHQVARHSMHMQGRAIDFILPGIAPSVVYRYLRHLHVGGVGRYPSSGFFHLDSGPIRTWGGR